MVLPGAQSFSTARDEFSVCLLGNKYRRIRIFCADRPCPETTTALFLLVLDVPRKLSPGSPFLVYRELRFNLPS